MANIFGQMMMCMKEIPRRISELDSVGIRIAVGESMRGASRMTLATARASIPPPLGACTRVNGGTIKDMVLGN